MQRVQVCRDALDLQPEDPTRGNELVTMVMQVRWCLLLSFVGWVVVCLRLRRL